MLASSVKGPGSVYSEAHSSTIDLPPAASSREEISVVSTLNSMGNSNGASEQCDMAWYVIHSYNYLANIPDGPCELLFGIDNPFPAFFKCCEEQSLFVILTVLFTAMPILFLEAVANFLLLPIRIPCMISAIFSKNS